MYNLFNVFRIQFEAEMSEGHKVRGRFIKSVQLYKDEKGQMHERGINTSQL